MASPQEGKHMNGYINSNHAPVSVSASERHKLAGEIESLTNGRKPVDLDGAQETPFPGDDDLDGIGYRDSNTLQVARRKSVPSNTSERPRDDRDKARPSLSKKQPVTVDSDTPIINKPPVDFDGLSWPSIGTRARLEATPEEAEKRLLKLQGAVRTILEAVGEDPDREGLRSTPERYAKAMLFFTKGYEENVRDLVNGAVFHEDHDELVIVKDIEVFSLCEHHMVPFTGKMHIGYIPRKKVIGLSKLARLAEMFSRRLQVQERLTKQVALAITEVLDPRGVAVVMEAKHLCMCARGVEKSSAVTVTSCMLGCMRNSTSKTREEFLSLVNRSPAAERSYFTHQSFSVPENKEIEKHLPPQPSVMNITTTSAVSFSDAMAFKSDASEQLGLRSSAFREPLRMSCRLNLFLKKQDIMPEQPQLQDLPRLRTLSLDVIAPRLGKKRKRHEDEEEVAQEPYERRHGLSSHHNAFSNVPCGDKDCAIARLAKIVQPNLLDVRSSQGPKVFAKLFSVPELVFEAIKWLDVNTLVALYSMSKALQDLMNQRFTAAIISIANLRAPEAASVFVFKSYSGLCQEDPAGYTQKPFGDGDDERQVKDAPSFRWLRMILFRNRVVDGIILGLAKEGHRLPPQAKYAIMKLWFAMDLPENARRAALFHNEDFWTNEDLVLIQFFFVKLDMRLTDPMNGVGHTTLRRLLLAQRSLTDLEDVLWRRKMRTYIEMMGMMCEWKFDCPANEEQMPVFGLPASRVGMLQYEYWGFAKTEEQSTEKFIPLEELIICESVRRNLGLQNRILDMMLWGNIDHKSGEDIWPAKVPHEWELRYPEEACKLETTAELGSPELAAQEIDDEWEDMEESEVNSEDSLSSPKDTVFGPRELANEVFDIAPYNTEPGPDLPFLKAPMCAGSDTKGKGSASDPTDT